MKNIKTIDIFQYIDFGIICNYKNVYKKVENCEGEIMKYCEITARINTFFEKDDETAKTVYAKKEILSEKIKDASEFIDKQEKESG